MSEESLRRRLGVGVRMLVSLLLGIAVALSPSAVALPAPPGISSMQLANMVGGSEVVVVGLVVAVADGVGRVEILSTLKGPPDLPSHASFRARPTWVCDISGAVLGETGLFFLERDTEGEHYQLRHSGRGRMPVVTAGGRAWVTFSDVVMPDELLRAPRPAGAALPSAAVPLSALRDVIVRLVAAQARAPEAAPVPDAPPSPQPKPAAGAPDFMALWLAGEPPPRVPDDVLVAAFAEWPVEFEPSVDWDLTELARAMLGEHLVLAPGPDAVQLLAWSIVSDDRPLVVLNALVCIESRDEAGRPRWVLASAFRHPDYEDRWRPPWVSHVPLVAAIELAEPPQFGDVLDLVSSSWWLITPGGKPRYPAENGWRIRGRALVNSAWKHTVGGLPDQLR